MLPIFLIVACSLALHSSDAYYTRSKGSRFTCKDPNGQDVDWYIVYKLPRDRENSNKLIEVGLAHYYMDARNPRFTLSEVSVNASSGHAIANTLKQMYDADKLDKDVLRLLMNDRAPRGKTIFNLAHQKGVLLFGPLGGFWMIQNTPGFPNAPSTPYEWPHSGTYFGQAALCISMATVDNLDAIGDILAMSIPNVYDSRLPTQFKVSPLFEQVVNGHVNDSAPWILERTLTSSAGVEFRAFSKHTKFSNDLYEFVADKFGTDLRTETWQNGPKYRNLPSFCPLTGPKVENILSVQLDSIRFDNHQDHSKYAVSDGEHSTVCVGDINRQKSQFKRGGGTVCFKNTAAWNAFNSAIGSVDACKKSE
ncbi:plancitoxin-1-like [Tubulanus polymorphus]|uniref:plancitoxin-1-like n=1 Tax=Tubulanus polymorphus TaxID=672921 RepID=UPI003DA64FEA